MNNKTTKIAIAVILGIILCVALVFAVITPKKANPQSQSDSQITAEKQDTTSKNKTKVITGQGSEGSGVETITQAEMQAMAQSGGQPATTGTPVSGSNPSGQSGTPTSGGQKTSGTPTSGGQQTTGTTGSSGQKVVTPVKPVTPVQPSGSGDSGSGMTYEAYSALSAEDQYAYYKTFKSADAFMDWYNTAKAAYEKANPTTVIAPGEAIDLSK